MKPGGYDVVCPQGSTLSLTFQWKINGIPVNLTGYTAKLQVRESYNAASTLIALTSSPVAGLTVDGNGNIGVTVSATTTAAVPAGTYVWDIELTSGTTVTRLLQGRWMHTAEVTR